MLLLVYVLAWRLRRHSVASLVGCWGGLFSDFMSCVPRKIIRLLFLLTDLGNIYGTV